MCIGGSLKDDVLCSDCVVVVVVCVWLCVYIGGGFNNCNRSVFVLRRRAGCWLVCWVWVELRVIRRMESEERSRGGALCFSSVFLSVSTFWALRSIR